MKTKSPLLIALGALALFVSVAFPSATAFAKCTTVDDVDVYYEYGGPTGVQVEMEVANPTGCIIYYTLNGANPTHDANGAPGASTYVYMGPIPIPYMQWRHFKCRAWKSGTNPCWYDSANITYLDISNPVQ